MKVRTEAEKRAARAAYMRDWSRRNPEKVRATSARSRAKIPLEKRNATAREWAQKNRDRARASKARYLAKHPERVKALRFALLLRREYGLTVSDYEQKLNEQNGRCAICQRTEPVIHSRWSVDHKHETGKFRGLLCAHCNTALGLMGDSAMTLRRAADYLDKADAS